MEIRTSISHQDEHVTMHIIMVTTVLQSELPEVQFAPSLLCT